MMYVEFSTTTTVENNKKQAGAAPGFGLKARGSEKGGGERKEEEL